MDYKILASGSKGNAVILNDEILIDCGITYKHLKDHLNNIKYLFITHIHSDHVNRTTFKFIRSKWKHIKIYSNYEVVSEIGRIDFEKILANGVEYKIDNMTVTPFECVHDVETTGYVFQIEDVNIIYATDTNTLDNAPDLKYNYFFIESNHDENKLEIALKENKYKYDVYSNAKRHLSTQQAKGFYYSKRKNKESKFIELHKSERFY